MLSNGGEETLRAVGVAVDAHRTPVHSHDVTRIRGDAAVGEHLANAPSSDTGIRDECIRFAARNESSLSGVVAVGEEFGNEFDAGVARESFNA